MDSFREILLVSPVVSSLTFLAMIHFSHHSLQTITASMHLYRLFSSDKVYDTMDMAKKKQNSVPYRMMKGCGKRAAKAQSRLIAFLARGRRLTAVNKHHYQMDDDDVQPIHHPSIILCEGIANKGNHTNESSQPVPTPGRFTSLLLAKFPRRKKDQQPSIEALRLMYESNGDLVNIARLQQELDPLQRCEKLDRLCQIHAKRMADHRRMFHSEGNKGALRDRLGCVDGNETLVRAKCWEDLKRSEVLVIERMVREQKLSESNYTHHGVGMVQEETEGKIYVCRVYCEYAGTMKRKSLFRNNDIDNYY